MGIASRNKGVARWARQTQDPYWLRLTPSSALLQYRTKGRCPPRQRARNTELTVVQGDTEVVIDASTHASHLKVAVAGLGAKGNKGILRLLWRLFHTKALSEMLGAWTARLGYQRAAVPSQDLSG